MNRTLTVTFTLALLCAWAVSASCGTISFAYADDGPEPGSVWVDVQMDPVDWGPCTECLYPDFARIHLSPAPIHTGTGVSYPGGQTILMTETGATVSGDGYSRRVLLDVSTTYTVSDALTRREGSELGQGGSCTFGGTGCLYEVTDYPVLEIVPITVSSDAGSFSVIKARY